MGFPRAGSNPAHSGSFYWQPLPSCPQEGQTDTDLSPLIKGPCIPALTLISLGPLPFRRVPRQCSGEHLSLSQEEILQ